MRSSLLGSKSQLTWLASLRSPGIAFRFFTTLFPIPQDHFLKLKHDLKVLACCQPSGIYVPVIEQSSQLERPPDISVRMGLKSH